MKRIVQIELTNFCNRSCEYCGNRLQTRARGMMSDETVDRCIEVLHQLGQGHIGLNHFGESLIHPKFVDICNKLNSENIKPWVYTNSDLINNEMIDKLLEINFESFVLSGHRDQNELIDLWQKMVNKGFKNVWWQRPVKDQAASLAGQVVLPYSSDIGQEPLVDPELHCRFLRDEEYIVLWDGKLATCCFDYDDKTVFGTIYDENCTNLVAKASDMCKGCPGHPENVV